MAVLFCKCSFYSLFFVWWYFLFRKDAFPGADGSTIDAMTALASQIPIYGTDAQTPLKEDLDGYQKINITSIINGDVNTLMYSIKHPITFIWNENVEGDWFATDAAYQNNTLWGAGTYKSVYDPCPTGWRVPPTGTWGDFSRTADVDKPLNGTFPCYIKGVANEQGKSGDYHQANGRLYQTQSNPNASFAWYPTNGMLGSRNGNLGSVGLSGFVWSAKSMNTGAQNMNFSLTQIYLGGLHTLARGFAVRCVQESREGELKEGDKGE